jgi:hypothetical protein
MMRNRCRHKLMLRDWLVEYGSYVVGYDPLSAIRKPELLMTNWPTKYESTHEEYSSDNEPHSSKVETSQCIHSKGFPTDS